MTRLPDTNSGKHTAGPWHIYANFNIRSGDGRLVANTGGFTSSQGRENVELENSANAHLIIAAPDLLDACESYLHAIAGESTSGRSKALKKMEAAIAKARRAI